jgi:hypothetical protein
MYAYGVNTKNKGRFYGIFALGDEADEKKYRKKKEDALKRAESNPMSGNAVKYREQRDIMIYVLRRELKMSYKKIENILNDYNFEISYVQIRNVCSKFGDKEMEEDKTSIKLDNLEIENEKINNEI